LKWEKFSLQEEGKMNKTILTVGSALLPHHREQFAWFRAEIEYDKAGKVEVL